MAFMADIYGPNGLPPAGNFASSGRQGSSTPGRSWVRRAEHDRRARSRLDWIDGEGVIVLNDRRLPRSKQPISLIAVSAAGVFVVETKHYKGLVHTRRSGPIVDLGPDELHVGRRDCTPQVNRVAGHVAAIRDLVASTTEGLAVPTRAVLCLTRAAWAFASAIEISGVCVAWPQHVAGQVQAPGTLDRAAVHRLSALLADRLPTAR